MDFEDEIIVPSKCVDGPLHDLSTPLGLAYERYMAFVDYTLPKEMKLITHAVIQAEKQILFESAIQHGRIRAANSRRDKVDAILLELRADIKRAKKESEQL